MSESQRPLTDSERTELDELRLRVAQLEKELAQQDQSVRYQRQFARAVEQSANTVMITDLDGTIQYVNPRFTELTGYTAEEIIGQHSRLQRSGLTPPETYTDLWNTLRAGNTWHGTFTNRKKSGELYYERATIFPVFDDQGQVTHYGAIKQDITPLMLTQESLKTDQEIGQAFQDKLKALHRVNTRLSAIRDMDELCRQTILLGRSELGFDRMGLLLVSDDGQEFMGTYGTDEQGNLRDERSFRERIDRDPYIRDARNNRDSATVWDPKMLIDLGKNVGNGWGIIAPLWDEDHSFGWLAVDNLVSRAPMKAYELELLTLYGSTLAHLVKRLRAEQALHESSKYMQAMLQANPDLIVRMSADGTYRDIKPSPLVQPAFNRELKIGVNLRDVAPPPIADELFNKIQLALATGKMQTTEYSVTLDGVPYIFEARIVAIGPDEILVLVRDVTDQRQIIERSLDVAVQQERVRVLTNFITRSSHEFRTPLSVIGVNIYLAEKATDPARRTDALRTIQDQSQILIQLVEGLLAVMRLGALESLAEHPVNLVHMLNDVLRKAAAKGKNVGLTIESDLAAELPPVLGNIAQLAHAFDHLLDNAIRFTPSGGQITLRSAVNGDSIMVEMVDTGIGINPDQIEHIFEQFYRADPSQTTRGLGLGLPIAQRIIELHGGRIEVESKRSQGSTFRVILPIHTA